MNSAGDKERSFVGSRQWIGAIEIGFVLETLLGVTSKVIPVASGRDMDQKASEIARHFDSQVLLPSQIAQQGITFNRTI